MLTLLASSLLLVAGCAGKSSDELSAEAMRQLKGGNAGSAIILFRSALEKDPHCYESRRQLAAVSLQIGDLETAERECRTALKEAPQRGELRLLLARVLLQKNQGASALREAQLELARKTGAEAWELVGLAHAACGDIPAAERSLQTALRTAPDSASVRVSLAQLYLGLGRAQESRTLLRDVLAKDAGNTAAMYLLAHIEENSGNTTRALELYRSLVKSHPWDLTALYRLGTLLVERGDPAAALPVAESLMRQFSGRAEGFRLKGMAQLQRGDFSDAITQLSKALQLRYDAQTLYLLGLGYYRDGKPETALSQLQKALEQEPGLHQARFLLAATLMRQRRLEEAVREASRLITARPEDGLAHNLLGNALLALGRSTEGLRELNRAIELDPGNVDARLKRSAHYLKGGKPRQAEADLAGALQAAPGLQETRLLLAALYQSQRQPAAATSVLRQGLKGGRADAPLYYGMATISFTQNRTAQALQLLDSAKGADPGYFPSYLAAAGYYAAAGDLARGLREYGAVLARDSANLDALLGCAVLQELEGHEAEAAASYEKALNTKSGRAYLAVATWLAKREPTRALALADEAARMSDWTEAAQDLKGRILLGQHRYEEALKAFSALEGTAPETAAQGRIAAYMLMGNVAKAEEQARLVTARHPGSAEGALLMAGISAGQGDLGRAIDAVNKGLQVERGSLKALQTLGTLQAKAGQKRAALETFARALKLNPSFVPAMYAQGVLLQQSGNRPAAAAKYREALAHSDGFVPALNNLASLMCDDPQPQRRSEGLRLAFKAYALKPGDPEVMDTLGYALWKNDRPKEAAPLLRKAAQLLPENLEIAAHLVAARSGAPNGRR